MFARRSEERCEIEERGEGEEGNLNNALKRNYVRERSLISVFTTEKMR